MGNTAPNEFRSGLVNGVGQHGFVARHGLYTAEQAAAADAVASRIGELDLRTVRLTVVDQHGIPRSKALSPEVAIAALSNGLDFSGAIYSLGTGNQVFVPAFAAGGGFGIDEFTGFPDVVLVPDATTFQVLPWADHTGWMLCDVYFSNGQPMPLDGRGLMRRMLGELRDAGYDFLAGIEVEYAIDDQLPPVAGEESALRRVFENLIANAIKYGALSKPTGRVDVSWRVDDSSNPIQLIFDWVERGGPPVAPQARKGFGSELLERTLAFEFKGRTTLSFNPAGLQCRIAVPLNRQVVHTPALP